MQNILDLRESALALKADERMIAFAGFSLSSGRLPAPKQGILKISASCRENGSGYLTLTFLVDTEGDPADRNTVKDLFGQLSEQAVSARLNGLIDLFVKVPLDFMAPLEDWYVEEVNLYFKVLEGRERFLVERHLLPALESILSCAFAAVEWWASEDTPAAGRKGEEKRRGMEGTLTLRDLFRRLFAGGDRD